MLDLLCIGEAMAELRRPPDSDGFTVGFAGDTFNTSVYAARELGVGKVGFYSRVGQDPLSDGLIREAEREGLAPDLLKRDKTRNLGVYAVATDKNGERSFSYWRSQSAARQLFEEKESLPAARIVYISGITLAILSPQAREHLIARLKNLADNTLIAYDSNFRPGLWEDKASAQDITRRMWDLAHIALPSIDDEIALFDEQDEEAVEQRFSRGTWTHCILKRGDRGPRCISEPELNEQTYHPARNVVDTTAAGDSFNAGVFAGVLKDKSLGDSLRDAHNLAAKIVGVPGAISARS